LSLPACRSVFGLPILEESEDFPDPKDAERNSQQEGGIGRLGLQDVPEPDFRLRTSGLVVNPQIPVALDFELITVHRVLLVVLAPRHQPPSRMIPSPK